MKKYKILLALGAAFFLALGATTATAADKVVSLLSASDTSTISCNPGNTFTVKVRVNDSSTIAGAAFTVTYDTTNLTLTGVTSTFFTTFDDQVIATPSSDAGGGYVTVDSQKYYSPLVDNQVVGTGSMLAAARFNNGTSGSNVDIFTLTFQASSTTGAYTISTRQSVITNTDAGYTSDPNDENNKIPYFVGISGDTYPTHTVTTVNPVVVTVAAAFVDIDHDDIDDNWEITFRPDNVAANDPNVLNYYSKTGDYDRDGYSDYVEYDNYINGRTDPDNATFDPAAVNAPKGPGYKPKVIPGINLLLLGD